MSHGKTPIHKRRFMVSAFQYKLMYGNLIYLIATVFVFFVALFGPVIFKLGNDSLSSAERDEAGRQLLVLHERVWFALPVIIVLCLLHSVLMSHRIAGPLYRIQRILRSQADGDLTMKVQVRRSDYLQSEAAMLTEMISRTAERVGAIRESYRLANQTLPQLMTSLGERGDQDLAVLAGKLGTQMDVLGQRIARFRTSKEDDESALVTSELLAQGEGALSSGVLADPVGDRQET